MNIRIFSKELRKSFFLKILITFVFLSLLEYVLFKCLNMQYEKIVENMIQFMLLNIAILAFYTWYADNKLSNVGLVFEFDKRWDDIIKEIKFEFDKVKNQISENMKDNKVMNDDDLTVQLELLIKIQEKLTFLLNKINYYENKIFVGNITVKSYIDFNSAIKIMNDILEIVSDVPQQNKEIYNLTDKLLGIYEKNLETMRKNIEDIGNEEDVELFKSISELDELIKAKQNEIRDNDIYDDVDEIVEQSEKRYEKLLGKSIGNNRYFKPNEDSYLIFTSRNWSEENDIYATWYSIPKRGKKSLGDKKDYYFIVRELNDRDEFPYLYISNENLKKLVEEKTVLSDSDTKGDFIHFYFNWNKKCFGTEVVDKRAEKEITLQVDTYKLGRVKLKDQQLFM